MKLNFKLLISFLICLSPLLSHSQIEKEIRVYPFADGTRKDSLKTTTKRVVRLLEARGFFEKTYLRKELVFIPLSSSYNPYFHDKQYLQLSELKNLDIKDKEFEQTYSESNKKLKKAIKEENIKIKKKNKETLRRIKNSPQIQEGLTDLSNRNDYEILMCPKDIFYKLDDIDPRENLIADSIKDFAEQILLGKPHNVDGYVNSLNYQAFDFTVLRMPDLIENLLNENLNLCKRIISHPDFYAEIKDVKLSYKNLEGSNKLWVYTSASQKTVFLSPYLIRAVFNISLYQGKLFRLAEEIREQGDDLYVYFRGKAGASAKQIDSAYFNNFVERFSKNISFVIGHELAHIYLAKHNLNTDIETACDSYSAYFYLSYFKRLDLGVFENLLIKSISSNELDFWGRSIDKDALQNRFENLKILRETKDMDKSKCKIKF